MSIKQIFGVMLILLSISMTVWGLDFFGIVSIISIIELFLVIIVVISAMAWVFLGFTLYKKFPPSTPDYILSHPKRQKIFFEMWLSITIFILIFLLLKTSIAMSIAISGVVILLLSFIRLGIYLVVNDIDY